MERKGMAVPDFSPTKARFISVEGIDGVGKSTVAAHLLHWLAKQGIRGFLIREPGSTKLGERIRDLVLDPDLGAVDPWAEALLYLASQAQQLREAILPRLGEGVWVIADRFCDATAAYQGSGRGIGIEPITAVSEMVLSGFLPHKTVLLDCDVATARQRQRGRKRQTDRMERESTDFHERVRRGYLSIAERYPERFLVVNAERALDEVLKEVENRLIAWLRSNPTEGSLEA